MCERAFIVRVQGEHAGCAGEDPTHLPNIFLIPLLLLCLSVEEVEGGEYVWQPGRMTTSSGWAGGSESHGVRMWTLQSQTSTEAQSPTQSLLDVNDAKRSAAFKLSSYPNGTHLRDTLSFALSGMLFIISKFEIAIEKMANEDDTRTDVRIFPLSPVGKRRTT